jgi:hypothetical protein
LHTGHVMPNLRVANAMWIFFLRRVEEMVRARNYISAENVKCPQFVTEHTIVVADGCGPSTLGDAGHC